MLFWVPTFSKQMFCDMVNYKHTCVVLKRCSVEKVSGQQKTFKNTSIVNQWHAFWGLSKLTIVLSTFYLKIRVLNLYGRSTDFVHKLCTWTGDWRISTKKLFTLFAGVLITFRSWCVRPLVHEHNLRTLLCALNLGGTICVLAHGGTDNFGSRRFALYLPSYH